MDEPTKRTALVRGRRGEATKITAAFPESIFHRPRAFLLALAHTRMGKSYAVAVQCFMFCIPLEQERLYAPATTTATNSVLIFRCNQPLIQMCCVAVAAHWWHQRIPQARRAVPHTRTRWSPASRGRSIPKTLGKLQDRDSFAVRIRGPVCICVCVCGCIFGYVCAVKTQTAIDANLTII